MCSIQTKLAHPETVRCARHALEDDRVPDAVTKALAKVDLDEIAIALSEMSLRACGTDARISDWNRGAREALREAERDLWKQN